MFNPGLIPDNPDHDPLRYGLTPMAKRRGKQLIDGLPRRDFVGACVQLSYLKLKDHHDLGTYDRALGQINRLVISRADAVPAEKITTAARSENLI
jgi:hypothetical protein